MTLDKETFCTRFKAEMLRVVGCANGGVLCDEVADYADEVAPCYFEDQHHDGDSPEECAASDVGYWND